MGEFGCFGTCVAVIMGMVVSAETVLLLERYVFPISLVA
ncbi:hypothetical protein Metlim_1292 [Methanoplanus limicola DSM 2279]|uniref:Uncharacterized protein n=1 Tax=Methanoplanus limicola DSM 2279 TaxID=937775 RepID=H1Z1T4_9EURY|nr:hypothetical protein Metlim_1292 [Methanoplanus limicola DSM 2279]